MFIYWHLCVHSRGWAQAISQEFAFGGPIIAGVSISSVHLDSLDSEGIELGRGTGGGSMLGPQIKRKYMSNK